MSNFKEIIIRNVRLTKREIDIVSCLLYGRSNKKISELLSISPRTVETHIKNIFGKLKINSREHLIGLIEKSEYCEYLHEHYKHNLSDSTLNYSFTNSGYEAYKSETMWERVHSLFFQHKKIILIFFSSTLFFFLAIFMFKPNELILKSPLPVPCQEKLLIRPSLMKKINDGLSKKFELQTVVITGVSGSGKTTLARTYARTKKTPLIWELNARSLSSLENSFENLALQLAESSDELQYVKDILNLQFSASRNHKLISFVQKKLKGFNEWLLLFDGIEQFENIRGFIPNDYSSWGYGKILITSENKLHGMNTFLANTTHINLPGLTKEEQKKVFHMHCEYSPDVSDINLLNLLNNIPPYPLDTTLAATHINITKEDANNYIKKVSSPNDNFLQLQNNILNNVLNFPKDRTHIMIQTIESILHIDQEFKNTLLFLSSINSECVPIELLIIQKESDFINLFISALEKYSLVERHTDKDINYISMHKSISTIIFNLFSKQASLSKEFIETSVKNLVAYLNFSRATRNIFHLQNSVAQAEAFLSKEFHMSSVQEARLLLAIGRVLLENGRLLDSKPYIEEALQIFLRSTGTEHKKTLRAYRALAQFYRESGAYKKALEIYTSLLPTYRKKYGDHSIKTLEVEVDIARIYQQVGKLNEALKVFRNIYDIEKSLKMDGLWTGVRLAQVLIETGFYQEALILLREHLEKHVKTELHKHSLNIIEAKALIRKNEPGKALLKLIPAVGYKEKFYGVGNHRTTEALLTLLEAYVESNKFSEAEMLMPKLFKLCLRRDNDHALLMIIAGRMHSRKGEAEKAISFLNKGISILLKRNHSFAYKGYESLGDHFLSENQRQNQALKMNRKKSAEAMSYYQKALELAHENLPADSPHLLRIKEKMKKSSF